MYRWNLKTHCSHFHTFLYLQWHRSREHPCVDPPGNIHPDFLMSACPSHTKHKMYFSDSGLLRILRLMKQSTKFSHFVLTAVNFPQTLGLSRYSLGLGRNQWEKSSTKSCYNYDAFESYGNRKRLREISASIAPWALERSKENPVTSEGATVSWAVNYCKKFPALAHADFQKIDVRSCKSIYTFQKC